MSRNQGRLDPTSFSDPTSRNLEELSDAALVCHAQGGSDESLNVLFRRHWKLFLAQVLRQCGSCGWAQDVCQEGCLKAIAHLPQLQHPEAFCGWVSGFITHERQHCRRNCKKAGTLWEENGTSHIERLSVETRSLATQDRKRLWSVLWQQTNAIRGVKRRVAVFMLEFYRQHEEFPSVRMLAEATHNSHGTSERSRVAVLQVWRQALTVLNLHP